MLRPTARPARSFLVLSSLLVSASLLWPAGLISASAPAPRGATSPAAAARVIRDTIVTGRGVKTFGANRGRGPAVKQELKIDRTRRGSQPDAAGAAPRAPRAADVAAAPPDQAPPSGTDPAVSFGAWEGFNRTTAAATCPASTVCPGPLEPPDPWVAVGPDHVVQTVNTDIRFTNREGSLVTAAQDLFQFFDLASVSVATTPGGTPIHFRIDGYGDPRWLYDQKHGLWLGTMMGWHCKNGTTDPGPMGFMFGAISLTGDPTGDYYQFVAAEPAIFHDFPMAGTSGDKITLASNDYQLTGAIDCTNGAGNVGASLTTFDWANLIAHPGSPVFDPYYYPTAADPGGIYFSPRPAVSPQGQSNTIYGVIERAVPATSTSEVMYFDVTGTASAGTTVRNINLSSAGLISPFVDPPAPQQPGGGLTTSIVDRRPTDAIWQDNVLTVASTYPCDPIGGGIETRDCARVTQVGTATATPTRVQDVLLATNARDTWYPGVGQSANGTVHVVYTQSSPTVGMSSIDRYQLAADAVNTFREARLLADGGALHYNGGRWGDFVGVAQDPRDTNAVWQGNQYTTSDGSWGTRLSQLQTTGSTFVAINPLRLLDSRVGKGLSGRFIANVPRTVGISSPGGIPAEAVAITANLTVVGQTAAGYASLTPLPVVNPTTSTINFPLGDIRANNLTSPLSRAGAVSIVYKAVAGSTAHVVLDVTGYFISKDAVTSHTYTDITPARVLDTRPPPDGLGNLGVFQANVNQHFQVAGVGDIPLNAKAITGNLTVVNQTRAGFVTLATNAPPPTPETSTINFPVGDIRANGVTIRLSDSGELWAVYKATGGSADLILDVTGYYLNDLNGARFVALTPGRRMDTRFAAPQEGLTGPFAAQSARTLVIEPYQGVPANAKAITGNLTVVGQTRAGYVSVTKTPVNIPPTSSLNFPLNDIRANGVTGPLSDDGSVGISYVARLGGTTHVILDLTGYFR